MERGSFSVIFPLSVGMITGMLCSIDPWGEGRGGEGRGGEREEGSTRERESKRKEGFSQFSTFSKPERGRTSQCTVLEALIGPWLQPLLGVPLGELFE